VFFALGHNVKLARAQCDVTVFGFYGHLTLQNQKKVIRIAVVVPNELALHFDHHDVIVIKPADDLG
jgi:hypothetical protein